MLELQQPLFAPVATVRKPRKRVEKDIFRRGASALLAAVGA
jgi:hypothetical protein